MDSISLDQLAATPQSAWELPFAPYSPEYFAFCTEYALHIAKAFLSGRLGFDAADAAMNSLFTYSYTSADRGMPETAWDVFNAFDQGEYRKEADPAGSDPTELHTRPMLVEALAKHARVVG
jgi:hypothetical protein